MKPRIVLDNFSDFEVLMYLAGQPLGSTALAGLIGKKQPTIYAVVQRLSNDGYLNELTILESIKGHNKRYAINYNNIIMLGRKNSRKGRKSSRKYRKDSRKTKRKTTRKRVRKSTRKKTRKSTIKKRKSTRKRSKKKLTRHHKLASNV